MALNPTTPSSSSPSTPGACLDKTCELEPTWRHWKSRSLVSERNVQELRDRMNKLQSEFDVHRRKSNVYIPSAAHGEEKRTIEMRSQLRQLTKTWQDDMDALDAAHVKLCRYLASLMRKKLPLELRNMIYTYACVEEQPLWFKRVDRVEPGRIAAMRRACDEGLPSENISQTCGYCPFEGYDAVRYYANHCEKDVDALDEWEELHTRTILDPRYVGKRIALEAVEVYYNRNTFCVEYDQLLWGFLHENMMGLPGITPADHVRSLHVVVRCEPLQLAKSQGHDQEDEREFLGLLLSRQWRCLEFFRERGRVEGNHVSLLPEDQPRMNNADEHRRPRLQIYFLVRTQFRILGDATTSASRLEAQRTCYNIAEALWPLMLDWSSAADLQGVFHENSNWEGMDNRGYHTAEKLRPLVTRAMLGHRSRVDEFEKAFENDNEHIGNFRWGKKFISSDVAHGELKKEGLEMLIAGDWGVDAFDITYRLAWYGSW